MEDASFFEALGIADQERIHTQFLAWLLGPQTSPLTLESRADIVRVLIKDPDAIRPAEARVPRLVLTEVDHVDLLVLLDEEVLFIENKLKSRQGAGQLARYDEAIGALLESAQHFGLWQGTRAAKKVFLTFSGETNAAGWEDLDYGPLATALNRIRTENPFVLSYRAFLSKLLGFRGAYLDDHTAYPGVDDDAGLKSIARVQAALRATNSELERFLVTHKLGTLFSQALFYRLASDLGGGSHSVGETRGHALLESTFFECTLAGAPQTVRFRVGTQLQRGTFKMNIGAGDSYRESTRDWIRLVEPRLDAAMASFWRKEFGRYRENGKRRAYRSWSVALPHGEQLEKTPLREFAQLYGQRLEAAKETWSKVLACLEREGIVRDVTVATPRVQSVQPPDADE